jgi:hypothetical protein
MAVQSVPAVCTILLYSDSNRLDAVGIILHRLFLDFYLLFYVSTVFIIISMKNKKVYLNATEKLSH